jgi:ligand-binding SRPBCC domain-containing protein
MANRYATSQWVPIRQEVVFAFFANPHNLPKLMPEASQMRIEELRIVPAHSKGSNTGSAMPNLQFAAGIGTEMLISFRPVPWLPFRATWLARITKFAWGSHFCDEQVRGPFAIFRHCHRLRSQVQSGVCGTVVTDHIIYALPFGALGRIGSIIVRRQLERTFAERQERLVRLILNN